MNSLARIKIATTTALFALLTACGGGGGGGGSSTAPTPAPDAPQVPWSSPAMILSTGETTKSIALSGCTSLTSEQTIVAYQSVTLVVNASGDMILNGVEQGGENTRVLRRINFLESEYSAVEGINESSVLGASIRLGIASDSMQASVGFQNREDRFYSEFSGVALDCDIVNPSTAFFLNTLPSSTRLAKELLNGITSLTTRSVNAGNTLTGGVAFWDNWSLGAPSMPTAADLAIKYFSLNLSSGVFGTSPNPNVVGTTYNVTIPTTPTSTLASFSESKFAGNKKFEARIDPATPSAARIDVCLFREGPELTPNDESCGKRYPPP
jgi:hypothetical protein